MHLSFPHVQLAPPGPAGERQEHLETMTTLLEQGNAEKLFRALVNAQLMSLKKVNDISEARQNRDKGRRWLMGQEAPRCSPRRWVNSSGSLWTSPGLVRPGHLCAHD